MIRVGLSGWTYKGDLKRWAVRAPADAAALQALLRCPPSKSP